MVDAFDVVACSVMTSGVVAGSVMTFGVMAGSVMTSTGHSGASRWGALPSGVSVDWIVVTGVVSLSVASGASGGRTS